MPNKLETLKIADAQQGLRHVFVRDLELSAEIGVHAHEKGTSQTIRINVDLGVTEPGGAQPDRLDAVVCYEDVVEDIKAILASGHINLVETLAERIAQSALKDTRVQTARVRIEKLQAVPDAVSVGVEIERFRG